MGMGGEGCDGFGVIVGDFGGEGAFGNLNLIKRPRHFQEGKKEEWKKNDD